VTTELRIRLRRDIAFIAEDTLDELGRDPLHKSETAAATAE